MIANSTHKFNLITVLCIVFFAAFQLRGVTMVEFGSSVEFEKAEDNLTIANLKGKAVLIIFFQSWCGICNKWAPDMIQQLEEAHGNNRGLALIALKADGGGPSNARDYMMAKGANPNCWSFGSDKDAVFYRQITGDDALWGYALIHPDGHVVKTGSAGTYKSGSNPKRYILAQSSLLSDCGNPVAVLPTEKKYPQDLEQIVKLAEIGCFGSALTLCSSPKLKSKYRAELDELQKDILVIVDGKIIGMSNILQDKEADGPSRYEAYKELNEIIKPLRSVPSAGKAASLVSRSRMDPVIQKEIRAEAEYENLFKKLQRASEKDIPLIRGEFKKISVKYTGTKYGMLAEARSDPEHN